MVALVAVPPGVVIAILPVVAVLGTVAVSFVAEKTLKANPAEVPLKVTLLAPQRFVPVTVTTVPVEPEVGEKLEIVGVATGVTVNRLAL